MLTSGLSIEYMTLYHSQMQHGMINKLHGSLTLHSVQCCYALINIRKLDYSTFSKSLFTEFERLEIQMSPSPSKNLAVQ